MHIHCVTALATIIIEVELCHNLLEAALLSGSQAFVAHASDIYAMSVSNALMKAGMTKLNHFYTTKSK